MKFKASVRHFLLPALLLSFLMGGEVAASSSFDDEDYTRYRNSRFNFSILVPRYWRRQVTDLDYKHIVTLRKGRHGIIKITSTINDAQESRRYDAIRDWYLTGIGRKFNKIVETGDITINSGITGRLYIIEFTKRRTRLLRRILITRYNRKILVIECGTSVRQFYNYSGLFNNVMGSIIFNEAIASPEKKKDEKQIDREQEKEIPEKETVDKEEEQEKEPVKEEKKTPVPPAKKENSDQAVKKETKPSPEKEKKTEPLKKEEAKKPEEKKKEPLVRSETKKESSPDNVAPLEENPSLKKEFENLDKMMESY